MCKKTSLYFAMLIILFATYFCLISINGVEYDKDDIYYAQPLDSSVKKLENKELL